MLTDEVLGSHEGLAEAPSQGLSSPYQPIDRLSDPPADKAPGGALLIAAVTAV